MSKKFLLRWHAGKSAVIRSAVVIVDEDEAWRLRKRAYRVEYKNGRPASILQNSDSGYTKYVLTREIMGAKIGEQVIHINGDVMDCRKQNLAIQKWTYRKPPLQLSGSR